MYLPIWLLVALFALSPALRHCGLASSSQGAIRSPFPMRDRGW
jgi:hypothetical protein